MLAAIVVGAALLAALVPVVDARLSRETNRPLVQGYLRGRPLSAALQPRRGGR